MTLVTLILERISFQPFNGTSAVGRDSAFPLSISRKT